MDNELLENIDNDWRTGKNPDARYQLIPELQFICPNPKNMDIPLDNHINGIPYPVMESILNNKEGSENWIKRIFEWYLGLGEFQWDAAPGEVKYPNQGFMNTRMREDNDGYGAKWHWATEVLVHRVRNAKKIVKVINKYFSSQLVHALFVNEFDGSNGTIKLNREIKYWIELGYHVIAVSCGKYCEGATLPEVMFTFDLTDGEGYDRAFQFGTRAQSSFYGYKNLFIKNSDCSVENNRTLFFKEYGYYITLSPSKHMSMVINSNDIINDIVNGHYEIVLGKIRNSSMLLGFDIDFMDMDYLQSYIRENYYGARLEGNLRARLRDIIFNMSDYKAFIKEVRKKNKKSKETERRNKTENSNESYYVKDTEDEDDEQKKANDKDREDMIELLYFFIMKIIEFVQFDFHRANLITSFNDIMNLDNEAFESFFEIDTELTKKWINDDILGNSKETTLDFFENIFNLYNIYGE